MGDDAVRANAKVTVGYVLLEVWSTDYKGSVGS